MKIALLSLFAALFVIASSAAFADDPADGTLWADHWDWGTCTWTVYLTGDTGEDPGWDRGVGYDNRWTTGGESPLDPTVNQKVRNYTSDEWSDWHVIVHNGTIRQVGTDIRKNGSAMIWDIYYNQDNVPSDGTSLTAIASGLGETITNMQVLKVYFIYDVINPSLPVSISQWPTTDWVPEPSGIAALAMGLAAIGMSIRRKLIK